MSGGSRTGDRRRMTAVNGLPSAVFLYGPSGSGKSTVGRVLAEHLDLPFLDLDAEIEARSGTSIPEIFAREGEVHFRAWERLVLEQVIAGGERIIALGGGALTSPETRALAEARGRVVLLTADVDTLLARLRADAVERPLLAGDAEERLRALLARRAEHYASFPLQVDTAGKALEEVAWAVQVRLGLFRLRGMESRKHLAYDVRVQAGGLDALGAMLADRGLRGPVVVVTDENVAGFHLERTLDSLRHAGFEAHGVTIPAGEAHKTAATVARLWEAFSAAGVERGSMVVALGGGVVGDLTGFAAATWLRGVPWVAVPTSLLAMVDASLGGKTGADLSQGKNLIGAFHPPRLVLADPEALATLPRQEFVNGLAEVVKHAVIGDDGLLPLAEKALEQYLSDPSCPFVVELIRRAMAVKIRVIEEDPYEAGLRAALNFGHTVGHGVELASGFRLRHGEAIAIGMVVEARMAERIGLAALGLAEEIAATLRTLGLPTEIPPDLDRDAILAAMRRDKKKAGGVVRFALPAAIGDVRVGVVVPGYERVLGNKVTG